MSVRPGTVRKVATRLLAALGLAALPAAPAAAQSGGQSTAPSQAPEAWVAYAGTVSRSVSGWLEEDSEPSLTARTHMGQVEVEAGAPRPLELKVWIGSDGRIARIDFPPFAHAEANTALRAALVGRGLPTPPPADMIQPLRIEVQPGD